MVDGNIMGQGDPTLQPNPVAAQGQQAVADDGRVDKVSKVSKHPEHADITVAELKMEGNRLIVVVESTQSDRVMSTDARNLAYAQRFEKGMTNAGIEAVCGLYVPEEEYVNAKKGGREVGRWRRDFRLTPGL